MYRSLLRILVASILLFMCLNARMSCSLMCYKGVTSKTALSDDSGDSMPLATQCQRKYIDKRETEVEYSEDEDASNILHANVTHGSEWSDSEEYYSVNSDDSVTNCFIFYDPHLDKAEFGCDDDNICDDASDRKMTSTCHKGTRGALYCCQGDTCNSELYLKRMSPPQAATICYSGTNNGTADISELMCKSSWCYQSNTYLPNGRVFEQTFGCDVLCDESDLDLTSSVCKEYVSHTGMRRRTCYCSSDRCNSAVKQINVEEVNAELPYPATDAPIVQTNNPAEFNLEYVIRRRWFMMVICVMGGILCLLVILLITVAVLRCQKNRTKKLSFTYVHLDDDTAAGDFAGDQEFHQQKKIVIG